MCYTKDWSVALVKSQKEKFFDKIALAGNEFYMYSCEH